MISVARNEHLQQYLDYVTNAAGGSLTTEQFDDDWAPIGPVVREELVKRNLAEERDGKICVK